MTKPETEAVFILSRVWKQTPKGPLTFYVESVPGANGADWGYTADPKGARPMSAYWMRRFLADMQHVNVVASFRHA